MSAQPLAYFQINPSVSRSCSVCEKPLSQKALGHYSVDLQKSEKLPPCFFHAECIKDALSHSPNCPSYQTPVNPPKGLFSLKDVCLQKIRGVGQALAPLIRGGCHGAVKAAAVALSISPH